MPKTDEHGNEVYVPCECRRTVVVSKQQDALQRHCRLSKEALAFRLSDVWLMGHGRDPKLYQAAVSAAKRVLAHGGWLTLSGSFGSGKTFILCAVVNEARLQNRTALYITLADLLACIRSTFSEKSEQTYESLWENVSNANVLAIDEVDAERYNPTTWAEAELFRMLNGRYQRITEQATVMATNNFDTVPPYLKSRMSDGRAAVLYLSAADVRPELV